MNLELHSFDQNAWARIRGEYDEAIAARLQWLAEGTGDLQASCRQLVHFSIWNGCVVLMIEQDNAQAMRYFQQALAYGLLGLQAPGSTKGLRVFDALMERGEHGSRIIYEHEIPALREPRMLSVADFSSVLTLAACFGGRGEIAAVARYPEQRYRNPNVIAAEDYYGYLRAWKELLLGRQREAKEQMQVALDAGPKAEPRKDMEAFVSLLDGDRAGFLKHLEERLPAHKKRYQKEPADPDGFICFPGLMLCRAARERGIVVEDGPYLPLRLLPANERDAETDGAGNRSVALALQDDAGTGAQVGATRLAAVWRAARALQRTVRLWRKRGA